MSHPKYGNFINGKFQPAKGGKTFLNINPADHRDVVGEFQASTVEDVNEAVAVAKEAYKSWRLTPAPKRAEILFRAGNLLMERKEQFANDMTREMGKVIDETRGDVQEAIDEAFYVAGEGRRLFGVTTPRRARFSYGKPVQMSAWLSCSAGETRRRRSGGSLAGRCAGITVRCARPRYAPFPRMARNRSPRIGSTVQPATMLADT